MQILDETVFAEETPEPDFFDLEWMKGAGNCHRGKILASRVCGAGGRGGKEDEGLD